MYYSVRAVNTAGTSGPSASAGGSTAAAPTVVTAAATGIGTTAATLNGTVNPNGTMTTASFQYGPTTSYGSQVAVTAPGSGTSPVPISAALTNIFCNTQYHFRAAALNAGGATNGGDLTFTTPACPPPTVVALPAGVFEDLAWDVPGEVDTLIDKMAAAGVQSVRMPFRWYMIEPTNDQWAFGVHDAIVSKLRAKGIEILGLLQHTPAWATGGQPAGTSPPVSDADWQDFITHVAAHYRGQVASWEVWNEENLEVFFTPHPDAVRYVQMLKVAFNAIRAADPGAFVVLGGIGGNGVYMGWEAPESRYYLQKIYDNGGKTYFDALAIHPCVHPITVGISGFQPLLQDTKNVMAANGDAAKPIWLTEMGWSVTPNSFSQPTITDTDQARWVLSLYAARASLGLDRLYWFDFHDLGYPPPTDDNFGLIRHDLTARPAYYAYMGMTAPRPFSNEPLVAMSSVVRATHITELRRRIDAQRVRFGLTPYAWTDPNVQAGLTVKAQHILDLRTALSQAYVAASMPPPVYADPGLAAGMPVKANHITQIRSAVIAIE